MQTSTAAPSTTVPNSIRGRSIEGAYYDQENTSYATALAGSGYRFILNGDYTDAEGRLRQALLFDPDLVEAQCNLGYVLNKTGKPSEAIPHLLYAYKMAPAQPEVVLSLAAAYQLMGNYNLAISLYKTIANGKNNNSAVPYVSSVLKALETEQRRIDTDGSGFQSVDSTEFYTWKKQSLHVYIKPGAGLVGYRAEFDRILRECFGKWGSLGVLQFVQVDTAQQADIECDWIADPKNLSSIAEGGETTLKHRSKALSHAQISLITVRPGNSAPLTNQEVRAICLHEIGHALGLLKHSKNSDDVMFSTASNILGPSSRDISILRKLYQTETSSAAVPAEPVHLL